ncbi:MAG: calcium/sodium antiporter [Proteobacteria bacterium]|nr:calcium/sodium antiporter [Pseudomonadota bacterium]MBU1716296.1 calcium/sodium antiporter [Pseudomonadota bacterium]
MLLYVVLCVVGFVLLYYGAEWLVKGSSSLARSLGVVPLVIGLTVVAFGTSAPELLVSVVSAIQGKSMIAIGNVVGSNICNIALVLGVAALFNPIRSNMSVVKRDIPIMLAVSLYLLVLSLNNEISRIEGATLFAGIITYTFYNYYVSKRECERSGGAACETGLEEIGYVLSRGKQIFLIVVGIICVVGGAKLVVDSAVILMKYLGVGEKFIGLTIVAFGTSLPELATSVVAAIRKEMDISIGNLVGSNVFNIMSVLGSAAMVKPIAIPGGLLASGLVIDYAVMLFVSFLPWLMMRKTATVTRGGGLCLLASYFLYLVYLVTMTTSAAV